MKQTISTHMFLFAFNWRIDSHTDSYLLNQHRKLQQRNGIFLKDWESVKFNLEKDEAYNEYVYFYKPVRHVLYDMEQDSILMRHYTHKYLNEKGYLELCFEERGYTLAIEGLDLKLYKTGVGIMQITLSNNQYQSLKDLVAINHLSQCIYPMTLPISEIQKETYPKSIRIYKGQNHYLVDDFTMNYKHIPVPISKWIEGLIGERNIELEPIMSGQMFYLTLVYKREGSIEETLDALIYKYKYQEARDETISYFTKESRIYGVSKYALICISEEPSKGRVYDQLVSLAIMQRMTLLHLSAEIARISNFSQYELVAGIQSVYEIYIQFINQMYFTEVTYDLEGTKLYELLKKKLCIGEELIQLDFEMQEIHEYTTLIDQSQSRFKIDVLTIIGAALVIPTFVTGFFGMNVLNEKFLNWWHHEEIALWMNAYVFLPVIIIFMIYSWNKKRSSVSHLKRWTLLLLLLMSIVIVWKYGCGLTP